MGGFAVLGSSSTMELWKERRSSCLTNSSCATFVSQQHSPQHSSAPLLLRDTELDSIYTSRSSVSSTMMSPWMTASSSASTNRRTRTRPRSPSLRSLRMSMPTFDERDDERATFVGDSHLSAAARLAGDDVAAASNPLARMFASATIRVWKQTPLPNWMNVFVPRYVRLQSGPQPFMEYSRQPHGAVRQRIFLTTTTRIDRLPKNKLLIEFDTSDAPSSSSSTSSPPHSAPTPKSPTADGRFSYVASVQKKESRRHPEPSSSFHKPSSSTGKCCSRRRASGSVSWMLRFETKQERDHWAKKVQDAIDLLTWINKFTLGHVLTETASATLAECYNWLDREQPSYVMKMIPTDTKKQSQAARNEIRVHHQLTNFSSHPNVLALHDSLRQQERAYLVVEYCAGGDLFEFLRQEGPMDEAAARSLFRRIVAALAYVHEQGVVHLDVKPENLLFKTSPMHPESIKLADFGSSRLLADSSQPSPMGTVSCTVGYAAPEVLDRGEVSFAADIFSAGAVLYTMLAGAAPFQSPTEEEAMQRTMLGEFSLEEPEWFGVSAQAKDLVCGMLETDPRQRLSMDEVLAHPWLRAER
ncbi:hypothetical protein PINS_up007491 [Pythium insidiosum]|nr:hypothetical protein PINS_up007491 [Pythium insidiosum]